MSHIRVQDASQTREIIAKNTLPDVVFAIFILKKHKSLTIYGEFEINFKKFLLILCRRLEAAVFKQVNSHEVKKASMLLSFPTKVWKTYMNEG